MINKFRVRDLIKSSSDLRSGFYNGRVVDRDDPDHLSRVRVEIFNLTEGIPTDKLPWYSVANTPTSSPNSKGGIPSLGSEVVVQFPSDDIYNGLVIAMLESAPPV